MKPNFEVLILTTESYGTPHLTALREANPEVVIHVHAEPDSATPEDKKTAWRNCDRNLRNWWRENGSMVQAGAVLAMEWDVFCNVDLATIIPPLGNGYGLQAAGIKSPVRDARSWGPFAEMNRLPGGLASLALGVVPLAVLQVSCTALTEVAHERWDAVFEADIFCELRLPTVVRACGFGVEDCLQWRWVGTQPMTPPAGASGMFHPVKKEVPKC